MNEPTNAPLMSGAGFDAIPTLAVLLGLLLAILAVAYAVEAVKHGRRTPRKARETYRRAGKETR